MSPEPAAAGAHADGTRAAHPPVTPAATTPPTEPANYLVHPAASLFPLMDGDAFNELVESVRQHGIRQPVVVRNGVLIDGRNRLRAVERLKADGMTVKVPTVQLASLDGDVESVVDWIYSTNKIRRQMTADQLAAIVVDMLPLLEAEAAERKSASQFQKGVSGNPSGKKQADKKSCPPARRDTKRKHARSTAGKVADRAGTSLHKARQAIDMAKGVKAGTVSAQDARAVREGTKSLRDVAPKPSKKKTKSKPAVPLSLDAEVARDWEKFKSRFPAADLPEVRRIVKRLVADEQKKYD